ncbi:MAG: hypothetical protein LUI04_05750 [Porphyromonadaceae bacterium]|nr:hypothetical protein [Porphyromonadaceae bacterium]
MKKSFILFFVLVLLPLRLPAEETQTLDYRRSSLYSILINHDDQKMAKEIGEVFLEIPIPEKYNNHDLSVKILSMDERLKDLDAVNSFIEKNGIASRMVSRWFDRDPFTGVCDVNLVRERGLYNASEFDREVAANSVRGQALLEDAGEDLISNTFLMVNDIRYVDKENKGKAAGTMFRMLGAIAQGVVNNLGGTTTISNSNSIADLGDALGSMMETLKGFRVIVHTYLYQLVWDEETSATFYREYYSTTADSMKVKAFKQNRNFFRLKYIGSQQSSGNIVSFIGVNLDTPEQMVRKACQRAIDENIVSLQRNFEVFKVKTPLLGVSPLRADIGLKEGLTKDSRFEVLEKVLKEDGRIDYRRVGVVKPVSGAIWDNRYMAKEEGAVGADLNYTSFEKVSGTRDFYPGMLIREIR